MRNEWVHGMPEPGLNTVYGVALNDRGHLARLGAALTDKPYLRAPIAPVLYVKPPNTWIRSGEPVIVPTDIAEVEYSVAVGVILGKDLCATPASGVLDHVAGYVVVGDVSVPHTEYFRPNIKNRCRDTFCVFGDNIIAPGREPDFSGAAIYLTHRGVTTTVRRRPDYVRPLPELLAAISEMFTLAAGDVVLMPLLEEPPPRVRCGEHLEVLIEGLGGLRSPMLAEISG